MDLKTRQSVVRSLAKKYQKASRKEKSLLLEELIRLTEYHRKYAISVLINTSAEKEKSFTVRFSLNSKSSGLSLMLRAGRGLCR